ncbi:MAG TPA: hypothetical protein VF596_00585 [Pyrinomonadaceae bacterium]
MRRKVQARRNSWGKVKARLEAGDRRVALFGRRIVAGWKRTGGEKAGYRFSSRIAFAATG